MPEQSSNHFFVGRRVLIEDEEWMITAYSFIYDKGCAAEDGRHPEPPGGLPRRAQGTGSS